MPPKSDLMGRLSALTFDAKPPAAPKPAVLATPPRTQPTTPAVQYAFPNRGDAPVATRKSYSLFETDLAHIKSLKERFGAIGHDDTTPSEIIRIALRHTVKAPALQLTSEFEETRAEDGRRRRHKKGVTP